MDLPPGFTVSQEGGVTYVRCDSCGAAEAEPHRPQVVLTAWAATHVCVKSPQD